VLNQQRRQSEYCAVAGYDLNLGFVEKLHYRKNLFNTETQRHGGKQYSDLSLCLCVSVVNGLKMKKALPRRQGFLSRRPGCLGDGTMFTVLRSRRP
ncbi:MAG: hypothetical protein M5R42_06205, partial [Rhodocyclaceae bacterium]|nr:hypothetical protein [Rhodocyclaceae bacterium]